MLWLQSPSLLNCIQQTLNQKLTVCPPTAAEYNFPRSPCTKNTWSISPEVDREHYKTVTRKRKIPYFLRCEEHNIRRKTHQTARERLPHLTGYPSGELGPYTPSHGIKRTGRAQEREPLPTHVWPVRRIRSGVVGGSSD